MKSPTLAELREKLEDANSVVSAVVAVSASKAETLEAACSAASVATDARDSAVAAVAGAELDFAKKPSPAASTAVTAARHQLEIVSQPAYERAHAALNAERASLDAATKALADAKAAVAGLELEISLHPATRAAEQGPVVQRLFRIARDFRAALDDLEVGGARYYDAAQRGVPAAQELHAVLPALQELAAERGVMFTDEDIFAIRDAFYSGMDGGTLVPKAGALLELLFRLLAKAPAVDARAKRASDALLELIATYPSLSVALAARSKLPAPEMPGRAVAPATKQPTPGVIYRPGTTT